MIYTKSALTLLSSSELNRCIKNGLNILDANDWFEVIKYPWLTCKMRKKIGHLWNCGLLKEHPRKPIIGIATLPDMDKSIFDLPQFIGMVDSLNKQFLDAEDKDILFGCDINKLTKY